ncbi:hypothetical protein K438DRAFT_2014096 [Mycena galopus ATCC 62051]|nr:hypothetical protein K438DRAFT_2014096 [Mycena galopus ATCC 62051]
MSVIPESTPPLPSAPVNFDTSASPLPSRAPPQPTNTMLKPLASFFDQFLQTARAETQLERTKRKKTPHKKQVQRHPNQANAPQPVSNLKSFLRNTVRDPFSTQRHPHPSRPNHRLSPSYSSNAFTNRVPYFEVPPSMTTQFRAPSSPDAHRVFPPTPYQVVLPSTPPTSRRPELYTTDRNDHDFTLDAVDSSVNLFCFNNRV